MLLLLFTSSGSTVVIAIPHNLAEELVTQAMAADQAATRAQVNDQPVARTTVTDELVD